MPPSSISSGSGGRAALDRAPSIGSGVSVLPSVIEGAGNGLFAERAFAKNELITEYYGEIISYEDAAARRDAGQHTHIRSNGGGCMAPNPLLCLSCQHGPRLCASPHYHHLAAP